MRARDVAAVVAATGITFAAVSGCTSAGAGASATDAARGMAATAPPSRADQPAASGVAAGADRGGLEIRAYPQPRTGQLVTVSAPSYGATSAALTVYHRRGGRWVTMFGPWTARIGNAGMAPPGRKREGDGRTPSGTFGFGFFFGALPDPGVAFRYRQAGPYDVWDDDPASPLYNVWVDDRYRDPGAAPEPMDVPGYDYGAAIAYNTARTPGLGSAIFLHVNIGTATTGCVTLPMGELLKLLRWLRPAQWPLIEMGVALAPPAPR
jgi:L,D-peptidoglycan transpeptidase YkuD (ErfK/YbiS/YcfS/YnhG family)